jgi:hypothetical protein
MTGNAHCSRPRTRQTGDRKVAGEETGLYKPSALQTMFFKSTLVCVERTNSDVRP